MDTTTVLEKVASDGRFTFPARREDFQKIVADIKERGYRDPNETDLLLGALLLDLSFSDGLFAVFGVFDDEPKITVIEVTLSDRTSAKDVLAKRKKAVKKYPRMAYLLEVKPEAMFGLVCNGEGCGRTSETTLLHGFRDQAQSYINVFLVKK